MIVGVTGHRPGKRLGGYDHPMRDSIVTALKRILQRTAATGGVSGMALGCDQYFIEACLQLALPFVAAVPFQGQEDRWPLTARIVYRELLDRAERIVYVSEPGYARWKMDARNHWVVEHCHLLAAVFDGMPGGTANTVLYANQVGREVHVINPRELEK